MKNLTLSLAASLAFLLIGQSTSHADPILNYNNIDLGYRWTDPDPGSNYNGAYGQLSYSLIPYTFLAAGYGFDSSPDADIKTFNYGGGIYIPLAQSVHLVGNVGGKRERIELKENDRGIIDFHEFGEGDVSRVYFGPELRVRIHPNVEVGIGFSRETGDGKDTDNYHVGTLFAISEWAAIRVAADFLDQDADQVSTGIRFTF